MDGDPFLFSKIAAFLTVREFNSYIEGFSIKRNSNFERKLMSTKAKKILLFLSIICAFSIKPVYMQTISTITTQPLCNLTCIDTRLSACLLKVGVSEITLGISEAFVCHRYKDCYGGASTERVPVQQKPFNVILGQTVAFRLDQSIANSQSLYWQMYNVTSDQFRTCNSIIDNKSLLDNITQNSYMYFNSTLFGPETHYFAGVANNLLACNLGLRIKVTVKRQDCAATENLRSVCNDKGKCIANSNDSLATCQCCEGYNGRYCSEYNACVINPCLNSGNCSDVTAGQGSNFTCACTLFYTGKLCETKIDYCSSGPCLNNGTCLNQVLQGNYTCNCEAGFTGRNCEININDCLSHNCSNNSTCIDKVNGFECKCQGNWTGRYCNEDINECGIINCKNGGSCVNTPGSFYCDCPLHTTGRFCEVDLYDNCLPNPCLNKGICIDLVGGFSCQCPQGFNGSNCGIDVNECASNPCSVQGTSRCVDGPGNYSCVCLSEYTGRRCEQFLDRCASQPCLNGGLCVNLYGAYECVCPAGYRGKNCQEVLNKCSFKPCKNNGTCIRSDDYLSNYTCNCKPGWTGRNCTLDVNECNSSPCLNGATCINQFNSYSCICDIGWNGTRCENNINACESLPCKNGATCTDLITKLDYTCTCASGYTGKNCSVNIDDCVRLNANCNNGQCIDQISSYYCNCSSDWYGKYCDTDRDMCAKKYCQNSATCENVNTTVGYVCACKNGWTGFNCSVNINNCASNPCKNGGVCNDFLNFYNCTCPQGYSGRHCEFDINECQSQPCENNATCVDQIGRFNCICLKGFDGVRCQNNINECLSNPCFNNASCVDGINQYTCQCQGGYTGIHCEIPKCRTNPCQNGATCLQQPDRFICQCLPGYTGSVCETDINECSSIPCQNNASCIDQVNGYSCNCINGYTGTHCETHLCDTGICKNGASCNRTNFGYTCNCLSGYTGPTCSAQINECLSNPCNSSGSLNCTDLINGYRCFCRGGYTGITCSTHLCDSQMPCLNGAECIRLPDSYRCQCLPGFHGQNCENNTNECLSNPCNNGTCIDGINGYTCNCPNMYTGTNCETNLDKCSSNPCFNNGNCTNFVESLSFNCTCTKGFTGDRCQSHLCDVLKPCQNNATCLRLTDGYSCQCTSGYAGQNCSQDINECISSPCQNGGVCQNQRNSFTCLCPRNFTGQRCETFLDFCSPNPCNTGSCSNDYIYQTFNCSCPPAYFGRQCETHICDINNPCRNGATCIRNSNKATCLCLPGYTGQNCTNDILECASFPCQNNGTCVEAVNSYSCNCIPEFTGSRCETPVNYCSGNPCRNSGTCINDFPNRTYKCICQAYATGRNCEVYLGPCFSNPCRNNGTCTETAAYSYRCACAFGYTGTNCEDITCPCLNNGRCINNGGQVQCHCQNGFGGSICESYYGDCRNNASLKCLSDSYCKQSIYGYTCQCPGHLSGSRTCTRISTCNPSPCLNNAGCTQSSFSSLKCNCLPGFTGQFCQFDINECLSNPCQNGGKCRELGLNNFECYCAAGYFGRLCMNYTATSSVSSAVMLTSSQYMTSFIRRLTSFATTQPIIEQTSITSSSIRKQTMLSLSSSDVHVRTSVAEPFSTKSIESFNRNSSYLTSAAKSSITVLRTSNEKSVSSYAIQMSSRSVLYTSQYSTRSLTLISSAASSTDLSSPIFSSIGSRRYLDKSMSDMRRSSATSKSSVDLTISFLPSETSRKLTRTLIKSTSTVQTADRFVSLYSSAEIFSVKASSSGFLFSSAGQSVTPSTFIESSIMTSRLRDHSSTSASSFPTTQEPSRTLTTPAPLPSSPMESKPTSGFMEYSTSYSRTTTPFPLVSSYSLSQEASSAARSIPISSSFDGTRKSTVYIETTSDFNSVASSFVHNLTSSVSPSRSSYVESLVYSSARPSSSAMQEPITTSHKPSSHISRPIQRSDLTLSITSVLPSRPTLLSSTSQLETMVYSQFPESTASLSNASSFGQVSASSSDGTSGIFMTTSEFFLGSSHQQVTTFYPVASSVPASSPTSSLHYTESSSSLEYSSTVSKQLSTSDITTSKASSIQRQSTSLSVSEVSSLVHHLTTSSSAVSPTNSIVYNPCSPNPCLRGVVCSTSSPSGFNCSCPIGYGGKICEKLECQCKNNGRCVKETSSQRYQCICKVGFNGTLCENQVTDCRVNNCSGQGVCRERLQGFVCACQAGYYGDRCQSMSNTCLPNLCNNGICVTRSNASGGGFTCVCRPGYQGQFCNFDYNECASSPCLNGGVCREDAINSHTCYCRSWSNGTNCEILLTTRLPSQSVARSQLQTTFPTTQSISTNTRQSTYNSKTSSQLQYTSESTGIGHSSTLLGSSSNFRSSLVATSMSSSGLLSMTSKFSQLSDSSTRVYTAAIIGSSSGGTHTSSCSGTTCSQWSSLTQSLMPSYWQSTPATSAHTTFSQVPTLESRSTFSATETRSSLVKSSIGIKTSSESAFLKPVSSLLHSSQHQQASTYTVSSELTPSSLKITLFSTAPVSSESVGDSTSTSAQRSELPQGSSTSSLFFISTIKTSSLSFRTQASAPSPRQSTVTRSSIFSPSEGSSLYQSSSSFRTEGSPTPSLTSSYVKPQSSSKHISSEPIYTTTVPASTSSSVLQSSILSTITPTTTPLRNLTCADNVCNGYPCFNESLNGMQFRCSCPYPTFGPRCIQGINIHFPLFNGHSYVSYASIPFLDIVNTIVMTVRTTKFDGLLLYAGHQTYNDFIMLRIVDGFVEFRFDAGAEVIFLRSLGRVNTGSLVTIIAKHDSRSGTGTLTVNSEASISKSTTTSFTSIQLSTAWYLGGAPGTFRPVNTSGSVPTFVSLVGCIKDLQVNNKPYQMLNAQSWHSIGECDVAACQRGPCRNNATCIQNQENPQQYTCKCGTGYLGRDCTEREAHCQGDPCNGGTCVWTPTGHICLCQYGRHGTSCLNPINITAPTFNQVYNYSSYIEYPWRLTMRNAAARFEIRMQFKLNVNDPRSYRNGILAFAAQSTIGATGDDFFALGIINNHTYLLYNLGGGLTTIRSSRPIDSSRTWHLIIAGRTGRAGYMYIDDQPVVRATSPGVLTGLDAYTPLYIGGVPDLSKLPSIVRAYFHYGFIGALYDVSFRTTGTGFKALLTNSTVSGNAGSQGVAVERGLNIGDNQVNDCLPNPCKNNGTCSQKGGQFECTCLSGWTGITCQDKKIPCIDYNPCSPGSICRSEASGIVCDCPLRKTGTYCDKAVTIVEPYFKKNSYMGFTKPALKYITKVFLRFKAAKLDGLLFYVSEKVDSSSGDYFAISLWQGYVYVRFNLGLGMTTMRTRNRIVINQWHSLYVERRYKEAIMRLDSNQYIGCRSSGAYTQLNVGSIIYLGGLPLLSALNPTAVKDVASQKDFEGCVSHFTVNDVIKVFNATKAVVGRNIDDCRSSCILNQCKNGAICNTQATNKQYPYSCSCTLGWQGTLCDQAIPAYSRAKFSGDGYIFYQDSITTPQLTNHIEFSFNTTSDGLLLWFGQLRTSKTDYLAIGIINNKLRLSFDTGSGVTEVVMTQNITDGKSHKVTVRRDGLSRSLLFILNGYMPILRNIVSTDQALDNNGHFYVGGLDGDVKTLTKGQYTSGLNGCIWDVKVQLSNAILNLNKNAANRGLNVRPCQ